MGDRAEPHPRNADTKMPSGAATVKAASRSHNDTRAATGVGRLQDAAAIAWRRSRSFNLLSRGSGRAGVILAPWLWPMELLTVAIQAGHIRRLGGASMTLTDGSRRRPNFGVLAFAVMVLLVYLTLILLVAGVLIAAIPPRWGTAGPLMSVAMPMAPLLIELLARIVRLVRISEARTLGHRRRVIADQSDRPVLMMTSFVRSRPGEGARLLRALRAEWDHSGTVVILNPANPALARYYETHGAVPDG